MKHPKFVTVKYLFVTKTGEQKAGNYCMPYDCSHTLDCNVQHAIDYIYINHTAACVVSVVLKY